MSTDSVELEDGTRINVPSRIATEVRGVDQEGDVLVPLDTHESPTLDRDGAEYLIPLTPCCYASRRGADTDTGVLCRACYREVAGKYGAPGTIAIRTAST